MLPLLREMTFPVVHLADDYSNLARVSFQGVCHWAPLNRQQRATCDVRFIQEHIWLCPIPLFSLCLGLLFALTLRF